MRDYQNIGWFMGALMIFGLYTIWHQDSMISQLRDKISSCSDTIDSANNSIGNLNQTMTTASEQAWADYDSMGSTLADLNSQTAEPIVNECSDPTKE